MHVKGKMMAFCGLFLALSVVCMSLGSVIETNTLFLLAAASFFVGIVIREFGMKAGAAFYVADVLLGFLIAPNKFYVFSFAAMGLYIVIIEEAWRFLGRSACTQRQSLFGRLSTLCLTLCTFRCWCFLMRFFSAERNCLSL